MKVIKIFTVIAALSIITACNTMEGAGKDIQRGGEKLENSAERNK